MRHFDLKSNLNPPPLKRKIKKRRPLSSRKCGRRLAHGSQKTQTLTCLFVLTMSCWEPCWLETTVYHSLATLSELQGGELSAPASAETSCSPPDLLGRMSLGQDAWLVTLDTVPGKSFPPAAHIAIRLHGRSFAAGP